MKYLNKDLQDIISSNWGPHITKDIMTNMKKYGLKESFSEESWPNGNKN